MYVHHLQMYHLICDHEVINIHVSLDEWLRLLHAKQIPHLIVTPGTEELIPYRGARLLTARSRERRLLAQPPNTNTSPSGP